MQTNGLHPTEIIYFKQLVERRFISENNAGVVSTKILISEDIVLKLDTKIIVTFEFLLKYKI